MQNKSAEFCQFFLLLMLSASACRHHEGDSDLRQIFADPQRETLDPKATPFIMDIGGCTAFIIDAEQKIAMTATHCNLEVGRFICLFQAEHRYRAMSKDDCTRVAGKVTAELEKSPVGELDYQIFSFVVLTPNAPPLQAVKLAKRNLLSQLLNDKTPLAMLGYPADKYQQAKLTQSSCRVRRDSLEAVYANLATREEMATLSSDSKKLLAAWAADPKYFKDPKYQAMRDDCYYIQDDVYKARLSFKTDCSVYGGNSGGPIFIKQSKIVIGMPASFTPAPVPWYPTNLADSMISCPQYYEQFFMPILGPNHPDINSPFYQRGGERRAKWDSLDRQSTDTKDFPDAIPMHLIAQASKYLQAHPQYLAD